MKALKSMTLKELVDMHNEDAKKLGIKPVKKFRDRKSAEKRVADLRKQTSKRTTDFPLPANPKGLQHAVRPNSFRGILLDALKSGMTREQMEALAKKHDAKDPWGKMLILHSYNGVGIEQKGDKFFAVVKG
jgi:hypothetical protein